MTEDIKNKVVDIFPVYPIRKAPEWREYIDHLRSAYTDGYNLAEQEIARLNKVIEGIVSASHDNVEELVHEKYVLKQEIERLKGLLEHQIKLYAPSMRENQYWEYFKKTNNL